MNTGVNSDPMFHNVNKFENFVSPMYNYTASDLLEMDWGIITVSTCCDVIKSFHLGLSFLWIKEVLGLKTSSGLDPRLRITISYWCDFSKPPGYTFLIYSDEKVELFPLEMTAFLVLGICRICLTMSLTICSSWSLVCHSVTFMIIASMWLLGLIARPLWF